MDVKCSLPSNNLRVMGLQLPLFAKDPDENLARIVSALSQIGRGDADLIVIPELSNTFYNYEVIDSLAEGAENDFLEPLARSCYEKGAALIVGLAVCEGGVRRNRAYFISSKGDVTAHYDKMHLISLLDEDAHFCPGNARQVVEVDGWKVGIGICFDLRFAELFLNYALDGCHFVALPACFPSDRQAHWRSLHLARAQECQCYFFGVNMGGTANTHWGEKCYGGSILASPDSVAVAELCWGQEGILRAVCDPKEIARQKSLFDLMANRPRPSLL